MLAVNSNTLVTLVLALYVELYRKLADEEGAVAKQRALRNHVIVELNKAGVPQGEIAGFTEVSTSTVRRVVQAAAGKR